MLVPTIAREYALKHIFHFHRLADFNAIYRKGGCFKLRWASDNRRVARKSEAFTRHEHGHIHFAVAVFIMVKRDGVSAGINASKGHICRGSCGYAAAEAFGILATVGEEFRVGGDTNQDIALSAA